MAKVYMMCAPVCCGKTTAAAKLRKEKKAKKSCEVRAMEKYCNGI